MSDLTNAIEETAAIDASMDVQFQSLTEEQQALLSKALFPTTHTDKTMLCGQERTLRPLPIKWSKQVHVLLMPFLRDVEASGVKEGETDLSKIKETVDQTELDLLQMLVDVSLVLTKFYDWEDVTEKIEEEDVYQEDLQALVVTQLNLQKANDFLLMGLRVLVGVMQQAEIQAVRLLSMFSGLS